MGLPQCPEIGLNNHDKPHLALVAPTTVIGTVRPRRRMKCDHKQISCLSYVTEISNSFG
jgi:hypothetical protein